MTDFDIDAMKRDMEAGTPGPWKEPYETHDNGWSLDTGGENTYVGVGVDNAGEDWPIAIVAVEDAYNSDEILDANARRIARVPEMEAEILRLRLALAKIADGLPVQTTAEKQLVNNQIIAFAALNGKNVSHD